MNIKMLKAAVAGLILSASGFANAGLINLTGTIDDLDDYIITEFEITAAGTVRGWTDSFNDFENFDPIVSLWASDGSWILTNDDNSSINPATQSYYDSGFESFLAAGTYYFTVSSFNSFPLTTENLFSGSPFDGVAESQKTFYETNYPNMGMDYSIWFDGADSARAVPEPSTLAIFALGIMGLASRRFKKQ